jgi:hypothetical protein
MVLGTLKLSSPLAIRDSLLGKTPFSLWSHLEDLARIIIKINYFRLENSIKHA